MANALGVTNDQMHDAKPLPHACGAVMWTR